MITFNKIRYKNILAVGNDFIELDLNRNKTTMILGKNGSGKCVLINTPIKIKNKVTGEILNTTIGDLYAKSDPRRRN